MFQKLKRLDGNKIAWIESHSSLDRHHKLIRFQTAMRWSRNEAVGFLHRFWWTVLEVAPTGDVTALSSPEVMSETLNMKVDMVQVAFRVMIEIGFLNEVESGRIIVHDWLDYAGRYLRDTKFKRDPKRWEEIIKIHSQPTISRQSADKQPTSSRLSAVPNQPNQPNLTKKQTPAAGEPKRAPPRVFDFESIWNDYPKKLGKSAALRHFKSSVVSDNDWLAIKTALANYKKHLSDTALESRFIQHGSTWFNNWRDWVTYAAPITEKEQNDAIIKSLFKSQSL